MEPLTTRKIDVAAVLSRTMRLYRDTWTVLIPVAAALYIPIALLRIALRQQPPLLSTFVPTALQWIAVAVFTGIAVHAVQDAYADRKIDTSVRDLFAAVRASIVPLLGLGLVVVVGVTAGLFALVVPGLVLATLWAVAAPVLVLEEGGVLYALRRSRELVRGNGWQVFGVMLLVAAIQLVLSSVTAPEVSLLVMLVLAPVSALAASVVYFGLREARGDQALDAATGVVLPVARPFDDHRGHPGAPPSWGGAR